MLIIRLTLFLFLLLSTAALAQSEKPERLAVPDYHFAFTFDKGSVVTFQKGSNGASSIRFPDGGKTTDEPLYRVLVYGKEGYLVSSTEAQDAGILPAEEQLLQADSFATDAAWNEAFTKIMATHDRTVAGQGKVKLPGGGSRSIPYFIWSRSIGGKTHYALMYVTTHGGKFIAVQVEASRIFTDAEVKLLTSSLELTALPAPPAPAAGKPN